MDSNDARLYPLVDSFFSEVLTNADLKTAMQHMQIDSVFDIVSQSQEEFANALAPYGIADAQIIYDNAVSCAHMISRLYLEQQVSSEAAGQRNRRDADTDQTGRITFQSLFNENWSQFCVEGDIAANNSPVAYLRALYRFALELEKTSTLPNKTTLAQRRPDIPELILDAKSAFGERPMLSIVNDTLKIYIQQYLDKKNKKKNVQEVLASEHFPLELPYDLHHHQCLLALGEEKPGLGKLSYLVSFQKPFSSKDASYGGSSETRTESQKLLSGFSPEQQKLLTSPYDDDVVWNAYGTTSTKQLWNVKNFKDLTGLTDDKIEQLLACGKYFPTPSINNLWSQRHHYGRLYINKTLEPEAVVSGQKFFNFSPVRLDSALRMVRLHRWTGISFAELDTLITNVDRSSPAPVQGMGNNTLRALGVHRYMSKRYSIQPEEFASFYHDMPTYACGGRDALFDQVFNKTNTRSNPLIEHNGKDIDVEASGSKVTLDFLKAGLDSSITQDDFLLIVKLSKKHLTSFKHDLSSASSIYRQARIAQMFDLSPSECTDLARLLGGEAFCKSLVTGAIKAESASGSDILDVLMALDWAVEWLKKNNYSVQQWCRLLCENQDEQALNPELEKQISIVKNCPHDTDEKKIVLIKNFLNTVAALSEEQVPCAMKLAETSEIAIFEEMSAPTLASGKKHPLLARALRAIEAIQALLLSNDSLLKLLNNPAWLAHGNSATLTPHTLYLLDRFSTCTRHHVQAEIRLLTYLEQAIGQPDPVAIQTLNTALAELLDWTTEEVSALTADLPHQCAQSMEEVDWIIRCKNCCKETGLSVQNLKLASRLNTRTPAADWKTVGEALIAVHA